MEETKKRGKKKLIALAAVAIVVIIIAVIIVVTVLQVNGGVGKAKENLHGVWDVFISSNGSGKDDDGNDVTYALGQTVEFDTSGGLDNDGTVIKYTVNGKSYSENVTLRPTVTEGVVKNFGCANDKLGTITCISDSVYHIQHISVAGNRVGGTTIKKKTVPFNKEQLNGTYQTELEVGGSGNTYSAIKYIKSAVIEDNKISLKLADTSYSDSTADTESPVSVASDGATFAYKAGTNDVTAHILETNENYIIVCVCNGTGNRYTMTYKLNRI